MARRQDDFQRFNLQEAVIMSWTDTFTNHQAAKAYDGDNSTGGYDDPDSFDDSGEVNDPYSPIWEGSTVHSDTWGGDSSFTDSNDNSQD